MNIDDRDRGRKGIEEMLVRMSKMTDMPDNPKKNKTQILNIGKEKLGRSKRNILLHLYIAIYELL